MKHISGVLFKPCDTTELPVFTPTPCGVSCTDHAVSGLQSVQVSRLQRSVNEGKWVITVICFN